MNSRALEPEYGENRMKRVSHKFWLLAIIVLLVTCSSPGEKLDIQFTGDANLEIGGPYVGLAFHHAAAIPQRISFFYPVANSIDHSRDYWTRDTSYTMEWNLRTDADSVISLGRDREIPFEFTPYRIVFTDEHENFTLVASYQFCSSKPAFVQRLLFKNPTDQSQHFEFNYRLNDALRTCHTYKVVDSCRAEIDTVSGGVYKYFDDPDTKDAVIFTANAGIKPNSISINSPNEIPFTAFGYDLELAPGASQEIILIIGSTTESEAHTSVDYLLSSFEQDVHEYEQAIETKIFQTNLTQTGNKDDDHSIAWAKAVMEANQHYLDGELVPMPCPAEYNFYFTHDVLVTDLAAVMFDADRVRRDLAYIISQADTNLVIPHAYYWKDGEYQTEYASSDNWNNFWFVQLAASYLRHSNDRLFLESLYPYISVCIQRTLLTLEADSLMWSNRPDWWDIGSNFGPSAYMTILAIRTLRDYIYVSATLGENLPELAQWAATAEAMETALTSKLWDSEMEYLVSYHNDGSKDEHYYIGSLLAVDFGLLSEEKAQKLVNTASRVLLDEKVGIYNAYPMDFEEWGDYYKFVGNEAGAKWDYFNGGIWPQGNAWYAMALIATDAREEAAQFIQTNMSLNGIWSGPNGQPAYYEVRNANRDDPLKYGHVDKPQFLWASAWYLYSLYDLLGVRENCWNIGLDPFLVSEQETAQFQLFTGGKDVRVRISGEGKTIASIRFDGRQVATSVLPEDLSVSEGIDIQLGHPKQPYIAAVGSALESCKYEKGELALHLRAYPGYRDQVKVVSPREPRQIELNQKDVSQAMQIEKAGTYYIITTTFSHETSATELLMRF